MFKGFTLGISSYFEANTLIVRHRLWVWMLVPGIVNLILFCFFIWGAILFGNKVAGTFLEFIGLAGVQEGLLSYVKGILYFVVGLLIKFALFYMYFNFYKYLFLILFTPVLSYLSDKTWQLLSGNSRSSGVMDFLADAKRSFLLSVRNFLIELAVSLLGFILFYVPVVNLFVPLLLFLVQSFYTGFGMLDFSNERMKLSPDKSVEFVRNNRGLALANGMGFMLMFLIPVIGWVMAPGYSVVAASVAHYRLTQGGQAQ